MNLIFRIVLLAIAGLLIDIPWLFGTSAWTGKIFRSIQGSPIEFLIVPAIIVYIAIGYLVTMTTSPQQAFTVGLATYAIYDFTNLATLKEYPLTFAIADSTWGGLLFTALHYVNQYI